MTRNTYAAELTADWTIDIWGKIRRQIQEQVTAAQASAADLANAQLSYQEQLAEDYFELRYQDTLKALLERSIRLYEHTLSIIRAQHQGGTANGSDEWQAQNTLSFVARRSEPHGLIQNVPAHRIWCSASFMLQLPTGSGFRISLTFRPGRALYMSLSLLMYSPA